MFPQSNVPFSSIKLRPLKVSANSKSLPNCGIIFDTSYAILHLISPRIFYWCGLNFPLLYDKSFLTTTSTLLLPICVTTEESQLTNLIKVTDF
jgi:hypothetical protein